MPFADIFRGKRVLVTGHTGFKGAWLSEWLTALGAKVTGLALPPATSPALFEQIGLARRIDHRLGDVRDWPLTRNLVAETKPDFVFHLAAQPLVRRSYEQPIETYSTNVLGTVHILEALRLTRNRCAVVVVTSDKCYQNREWVHGYREDDALGGHDPYSSSKGAAELVVAAYRNSYFSKPDSCIQLASARAGNVIGGGDWSSDRIVPDCVRSLAQNAAIAVRNPTATRPWQHVLEPLGGYLWLAACLDRPDLLGSVQHLSGAFNFGPENSSNRTVKELVEQILAVWPGNWSDSSVSGSVHEAKLLGLSIEKAHHLLKWKPVWGFDQTVKNSIFWYQKAQTEADLRAITLAQIEAYVSDARLAELLWTR